MHIFQNKSIQKSAKTQQKSAKTQQNYFSRSAKSIQKSAKTQQKKILGKKLKTEMKDFIFLIFFHAFACIKPPV